MVNSKIGLAVKSVTVSIEVPMHNPIMIYKEKDIQWWENFFIKLRDREPNSAYQKNYDRCRALLKYASSFWGKLKGATNVDGGIIFTFEFADLTGLDVFERDLYKVVEGKTN